VSHRGFRSLKRSDRDPARRKRFVKIKNVFGDPRTGSVNNAGTLTRMPVKKNKEGLP